MWFMLLLNRPLGPEFTRFSEQQECELLSIEQRQSYLKPLVPWLMRWLFIANFTGRQLKTTKHKRTGLQVYSRPRRAALHFSELCLSSAVIVNSNSLLF